jgi:hypothetical protein
MHVTTQLPHIPAQAGIQYWWRERVGQKNS